MADTAVAEQVTEITSKMVGTQWPGVGVGVLIRRAGKILFGYREGKSTHGKGQWCPPGGKLGYGESLEDCAIREAKEECGLDLTNVHFSTVTNDYFASEGRHFISVFMIGDAPTGEPQVLEPEKMSRWEWCDWDNLPSPLFFTIANLLKVSYSPFVRPIQVGLKALIRNTEGKYLLFQRRYPREGENHRIWEIPGGRMDSGEEVPEALAREVNGETGLEVTKILRCVGVQSILRNPKLHVVRNTFEVEVSGSLKIFSENDEHDKVDWFTLEQIEELTLDPYLTEVFATIRKETA